MFDTQEKMIYIIILSLIIHVIYTIYKSQNYNAELLFRLIHMDETQEIKNIPNKKNIVIGEHRFPFLLYKNGITLVCNTEEQVEYCKKYRMKYVKSSD